MTKSRSRVYFQVSEPFRVTKTFGPMHRSSATPTKGTKCTVVGWGYTTDVSALSVFLNTFGLESELIDCDLCNRMKTAKFLIIY